MPKDLAHIEAVGQRHPIRHDVVTPEMPVGSTIAEIVGAMDLDTERYGLPVVTMIRGGEISVVPLDMWGKTRPLIGTRVEVAFPVRDPGSIALIASLAIPQAATAIAGALQLTGLAYSLVVAAVTIVGTLLVQALIPPAKTEGASGIQNYAITGTQNAANPYGVFPTVLGRHRIYPPLTATGFSENAGQDVYYYGRMTFGYGPLALEDLRIGTTQITEFAAAEVELEFRNVDRDLTLAAMPGLAPFVVDRTGEENKPRFKLTEVGNTWTFAPRAAADQVTIEFNVSAQDKISGYTFIVEEAVAGSGTWAQVASFTLQDPVTNHDPLSGLQETRTFTSASYSDGVEREYRVTLTGSTPREGDYTDNWLTFFSGKGVDAVTVTKASATYHEVQPGWRYGTDSMFLYPEDITQDDENALPEPGAPVVRYTREASSAASVDISFSRGLYDGTDDGLESHDASFAIYYQPVAGGIVEEDWVLVASPTYEAKSTTALRYTVPMSFPEPAQYAIKVERTSGIDYSTRDQNRAWVTAIRSMSGEPLPSPEGIAEVAFKIKASDQLNGRLDSLNGIVQQLAPVWDGSVWTDPQPVRHPAWLYAQALRGPQQRRPVADSRLDLDAIKAWADQEPHWTCDYVIDTPTQTAEVLDVICAAGRARRTLSDFRWSVIRDGAAGPVRQTFTPRNSWGYSAKRRFPREIHGFRVKARSERLEWEEDEILVLKDGFTRETATELETLQLAGTVVTADDEDEGNAYRLGRYHLAVAENRPEIHTFFADWEHIRVQRGDKIRFVHDVPMMGHGQARITGITEDGSGNVATITLDELFDFERDSFRLAVRNVQAEVIFQALSPEDPRTRVWTPEVQVSAADIAVGDLVAVEETGQASAEMLVTGIYPRKDESAKITCVDAVPAILQADTGTIPTYSPIVTNPRERADYGLPPAPAVISAYSDSTTQLILPDLSVRPRIAVQLAPFATRSASEGLTTQLRWREAGSASVYTYGEALSGVDYSLLTGALDEGLTYEGQVRIVAPDGQTRGWKDWPNTVVASIAAPAPPAIAATVTASSIPDAADNGRRPAIELAWTLPINRTLRVTWEVRVAATGVVVQRGLFAEASSSSVLIADGILPATDYEVHASFVTAIPDQRTWSAWLPVTTSDLRLTPADLSDDLANSIDVARARHDDALDDATGAVGDLRDRILASLSGVPTFDALDAYLDGIGAESIIGAIETSLGPLSAPTSLSSQIVTERERLDLLLPRISDAEEATSDIAGLLTQFGAALFATDKRISDAGIYVDPDSGTVKIAAYEYLEGQVSDVSIELDAARAQIDLKASVAYVNQALSDLVLDPTQIPLLDDLNLRISTAEQTLDAVEGTVTSLTETLTVEGGLVTMTTVTETLDSLQGQITDRVTSATFNAAEARLSAAEQTISAFPDNAEISSAVEASRVLPGELSDASALMVQEMGERFASDQAIRVAEAQAREDLRAYIDEQDGAVAENVTQLRSQVDTSVAQIEDTLRTRATEAEATAEAVTQLQSDIESADGERAAQADAIDELTTRVTDTETGLVAESADRTLLTSGVREIGLDLDDLSALTVGEMWAQFKGSEDLRAGIALAASELHTYVEEGQLAEASERLQLGAALEDAVAEIQLERLARVTEDEALAQSIESLGVSLGDATASAIDELTVRVEETEDGIVSVSADITTLQNSINDPETGLAANAEATTALTNRVEDTEEGITSVSADITTLQNSINDPETGLAANAEAISGVISRVDGAEGGISALAGRADVFEVSLGAEQLIPNGAFATGDLTGWTEAAAEISVVNKSSVGGAVGSTAPRLYLLRMASGSSLYQVQVDKVFSISEGTRFSIEIEAAAASGASGTVDVLLEFRDADGGLVSQQARGMTVNSTTWSRPPAQVVTAPAGASRMRIFLRRVGSFSGSLYVAEARVERMSQTELDARARIETIEGSYVDANGAISAVEQRISAEYGDLEALASATAFAEAGIDGISAGYVWQVNGQSLLELVSVQDGVGGPVSTFKIAADYVEITGIAQIDSAVLQSLTTESAFINNLTVGTINYAPGSVETGKIATDAATVYGIGGSGAVTNNSATATEVVNFTLETDVVSGLGVLGAAQIRLDDVAGNFPSGFEINAFIGGVQVAEYVYSSAQADPTARVINMPLSRVGITASNPQVILRIRNMGGKGILSSNVWALARKR